MVIEDVGINQVSTLSGGITGKGWVKGQSGNPSGKPKDVLTQVLKHKLAELAPDGVRTNAEALVDRLIDIGLTALPGEATRAIAYTFDRIEGTARQSIDLRTADDDPRTIALAALAQALREAAGAEQAQLPPPPPTLPAQ